MPPTKSNLLPGPSPLKNPTIMHTVVHVCVSVCLCVRVCVLCIGMHVPVSDRQCRARFSFSEQTVFLHLDCKMLVSLCKILNLVTKWTAFLSQIGAGGCT